jgi:hypothetical protein
MVFDVRDGVLVCILDDGVLSCGSWWRLLCRRLTQVSMLEFPRECTFAEAIVERKSQMLGRSQELKSNGKESLFVGFVVW